jgi:hypothetical protein
MVTPQFPSPLPAGNELEVWREKLEWSRARYVAASRFYRRLLEKESGGCTRPDSELVKAAQAESIARLEFSRLLRVFADLTIDGKTPEAGLCDSEAALPSRLGPSAADEAEPESELDWELLWPAAFR